METHDDDKILYSLSSNISNGQQTDFFNDLLRDLDVRRDRSPARELGISQCVCIFVG